MSTLQKLAVRLKDKDIAQVLADGGLTSPKLIKDNTSGCGLRH